MLFKQLFYGFYDTHQYAHLGMCAYVRFEGMCVSNPVIVRNLLNAHISAHRKMCAFFQRVNVRIKPAWLLGLWSKNAIRTFTHPPKGGYSCALSGALCYPLILGSKLSIKNDTRKGSQF